MRSLVSFLGLLLVAVVQATSAGGNRLLVILEDVAEKAIYSQFLGDLEGMRVSIVPAIIPPWHPTMYIPSVQSWCPGQHLSHITH